MEQELGTTFILPMAAIIETGNHITHANGDKFVVASEMVSVINMASDAQSPWAAFTEQGELWKNEGLKSLAARWKETVKSGQSLADASIVDVANYYAELGCEVEIYTGDEGLKAYQPVALQRLPRRRARK